MATLSIQKPGMYLSLKSERLVLRPPNGSLDPVISIPIHEVDRVTLAPRVGFSAAAMAHLLKRHIPIDFIDWNGRHLGSFQPPTPPRARARLKQYQLEENVPFRLEFARRLILSKIRNERRILQRLHQRHHAGDSHGILISFKKLSLQVVFAKSLPSLRGIEGMSAKAFLENWATFLPSSMPFERRSIRPPQNPVNAVISYLSALIYGELLSACFGVGLDPALGVLHESTDDRYSLPLDLMEPFRPALIYPLALRLLGQSILTTTHFQAHNPGVWLSPEGRRILHLHFEKLMLREFFSQHLQHRTTLREQLKKAAQIFKSSLSHPSTFLPFQLNGTTRIPSGD